MISPELAAEAAPLLSTIITTLIEGEHGAAARAPAQRRAEHAMRLHQLGSNIATLADALAVILRRSEEAR